MTAASAKAPASSPTPPGDEDGAEAPPKPTRTRKASK